MGRIAEPYGLKGWLKLEAFSSDPQALLHASVWWLRDKQNELRPLVRELIKNQGGALVVKLQGINDRSAAELLKQQRIEVPRSEFPAPEPGEYYWADLIGCEVWNADQKLGTVQDLIDNGAHSVLQVKLNAEGQEKTRFELIPFVAAYVGEVNLASKRIEVNWQLD